MRSPIGRLRIASTPSNWMDDVPNAHMANKKRAAVPALPTKRSGLLEGGDGNKPPHPVTLKVSASRSWATSKPKAFKHAAKMRVSSLSSAPVKVEVPRDNAASNSARLLMLLEPGTLTMPRAGARKDAKDSICMRRRISDELCSVKHLAQQKLLVKKDACRKHWLRSDTFDHSS